MANINQALNIENSVFGVAIFGQDVFLNDLVNQQDGVYYTKIFQKNATEIWHRVAWLDNMTAQLSQFMKVEVRIRTGNALPIKDFTNNTRYTLDEINQVIQTQDLNEIDTIFERAMLNRSVISDKDVTIVDSKTPNYPVLGTSYNSFRITSDNDTIWNYWSLPIINSPSFIPQNQDYNYLQARISLQSNDLVNIPKMFRINFTSILKSSFTQTLTVTS